MCSHHDIVEILLPLALDTNQSILRRIVHLINFAHPVHAAFGWVSLSSEES
jgi:hypothetical protein